MEKYKKYAAEASSPNLKNLFSQIESHEQLHLQTINQIINGSVPIMSGSSNGQQQNAILSNKDANYATNPGGYKNDCYLCSDALASEKHVSSDYNIAVFEFKNTDVRNALNHIQKEEQEHGEMIYNHMSSNGMYQ
ncbi:MAG: spore coat protein [Clostridiales bacterium]